MAQDLFFRAHPFLTNPGEFGHLVALLKPSTASIYQADSGLDHARILASSQTPTTLQSGVVAANGWSHLLDQPKRLQLGVEGLGHSDLVEQLCQHQNNPTLSREDFITHIRRGGVDERCDMHIG
jgi:hypothetical protein